MNNFHIQASFRQNGKPTMPKVRRTIRSPIEGKEEGL